MLWMHGNFKCFGRVTKMKFNVRRRSSILTDLPLALLSEGGDGTPVLTGGRGGPQSWFGGGGDDPGPDWGTPIPRMDLRLGYPPPMWTVRHRW